jgi:hypothetical protein
VTFKASNEGRFAMPRKKKSPTKRVRIRSKSLDQIDETKLALALWLMAKRKLDEQDGEGAAAV